MKELKFPLLKENQIEVRVGQVSKNGCSLLLYKTSRTDAEILDKIVGQGNWQKRFYTLQGVGIGEQVRSIVVCSVGIFDDDRHEWVWKDDSGTESQVEQDKGVCSDAFKRAAGGSCWGIGRELYYTGFIFAKVSTQPKSNGKGYELADKFMSFEVKEIKWYENPLTLKTLVIVDNNGNVVFSKGSSEKVSQTAQKPNQIVEEDNGEILTEKTKERLQDIIGPYSVDKLAKFKSWLSKNFGTTSIAELTERQAQQVIKALSNF